MASHPPPLPPPPHSHSGHPLQPPHPGHPPQPPHPGHSGNSPNPGPHAPHPHGKNPGRPPSRAGAEQNSGGKQGNTNEKKGGAPPLPPFKQSLHYYILQRIPKHLLKSRQSFSWEHATHAEMGGMTKDEVEGELAHYRRLCRKTGRNIADDYAALTNLHRRRALDDLVARKSAEEKDPRAQWHLVALFLKKKLISWTQYDTFEMRAIILRSEKQGVSVAPMPKLQAEGGKGKPEEHKPPAKKPSKKMAKPDDSGDDENVIHVSPAPPPLGGFTQPPPEVFRPPPHGHDQRGPPPPPPGPIRGPNGPWFPYEHQQNIDISARLNPMMPNLDTNERSALPNPRKAPEIKPPEPYNAPPFEPQLPVQEIHNHYYGGQNLGRTDPLPLDHVYNDSAYDEPHFETERDRITREYEGAPFMPKIQDVEGSYHARHPNEWGKHSPGTQRHTSRRAIEAPRSPKIRHPQPRHSERRADTWRDHRHHRDTSSTASTVSTAGSSVFSRGGSSEFTGASSPEHGSPIQRHAPIRRGSIHRTPQERAAEFAPYAEPVTRTHHKPRPVRVQGSHRAPTPPQGRSHRLSRHARREEYHNDFDDAPLPHFRYRTVSRAVSPARLPPLARSYTGGFDSPALSPRIPYRRQIPHGSPNLDRLSLYDTYPPRRGGFREHDQQREALHHMMNESRRRRSTEQLRHQFAYDHDQRRRGRVDEGYLS